MAEKPISPKRQRFIEEYLVDLNATQAAIRSGYSKKTAAEAGYELLRIPHIADAIAKAKADRAERTGITADAVVQELSKLGMANMLDYIETTEDGAARVDLSAITRDQAAAIQEVQVEIYVEGNGDEAERVKFKLADKRGALDLLGKHLGIFEQDNRQRQTIINIDREEVGV